MTNVLIPKRMIQTVGSVANLYIPLSLTIYMTSLTDRSCSVRLVKSALRASVQVDVQGP